MPVALRYLLLAATLFALGGCSAIISRSAANLNTAVTDHDDPGTVRDGAPAYLLLMDSLVVGSPDNKQVLRAAADLYSAYAAVFVDEPERAQRLTLRSYEYGRRAFCAHRDVACIFLNLNFDVYETVVTTFKNKDVPYMFSLAQAWLARIRAHGSDWSAVAELPKAETLLRRVLELQETYGNGTAHVYMGILNTLRPPALGGKPEEGKRHFERAIELSAGKNLFAKVQYAESYGRLMFDRELHDRLLNEVVNAETESKGYTLLNVFAKQRATLLIQSADEYF
ncbi:MAG: TRAP transporter TatT component family protein [Gammaproteobacteria bacterium]